MICHEFKCGIGTSSRRVSIDGREFTVGVLVQANYGLRETLRIAGVPVGEHLREHRAYQDQLPHRAADGDTGSIIIVVATDAPLLPHQLDRLAQRAGLGVARLGGAGENGSGDIFIAFSNANRGLAGGGARSVEMLGNDAMNPLFYATIEATEEAIVNAMLQAETMSGKDGAVAHRLDPVLLLEVMRKAGRA
jgi:D-aminopeptidase